MTTSASIKRVAELISDVDEGRLVVRPAFQRRLVWTNSAKENLIDTVLKEYPFPEIFVATGDLDLETTRRTTWLVDGQQRITTIRDYVKGSNDLRYKTITRFKELSPAERTKVLEYSVAVRDLGTVTPVILKEIFRRINSTDFALKGMEVLNALYDGALNGYCEELSRHSFFNDHQIFSAAVRKRMYDVTFCVILVGTLLGGYYRRDERNEEFLERYNDDFPERDDINVGLQKVFNFLEECSFDKKSRIWKQTDLFTVLVEVYNLLVVKEVPLNPVTVAPRLASFFEQVDAAFGMKSAPPAVDPDVSRYLKAATKATNDKYARLERAEVIAKILTASQDIVAPTSSSKKKLPISVSKPISPSKKKSLSSKRSNN